MECFTNPLNQTISDVVELHEKYKTCHENNIILQQNYSIQAKQLTDMEKEKNDSIITLNNTVIKQDACEQNLHSYKTYLDFIGSINHRIQNMDVCNSLLKSYCDCLKDGDSGCVGRFFKYLSCEDALPQTYNDKFKAAFNKLLADVIMVRKNLTELLITGDFKMMEEIYEQKKNLPMDNCQFICSLDVQSIDSDNATYWKKFSDAWNNIFSQYFINHLTS